MLFFNLKKNKMKKYNKKIYKLAKMKIYIYFQIMILRFFKINQFKKLKLFKITVRKISVML